MNILFYKDVQYCAIYKVEVPHDGQHNYDDENT